MMATITKSTGKEPLFHIVRRTDMPMWKSWLIRILSVLASLIVCAVIIVLVTGDNPIQIYATMFNGNTTFTVNKGQITVNPQRNYKTVTVKGVEMISGKIRDFTLKIAKGTN